MANPIKYNTSAETLALKKGNFWIGTGDVGKGPTSSTGFYNGIEPPSGGYTIYLNKASGGPSIYTVSTEAQLTALTNSISVSTNLIKNNNGGNFADGTIAPFNGSYGTLPTVVDITNDKPYNGSTSTKAAKFLADGGMLIYTDPSPFTMTVGVTYTFSFWYRQTNSNQFYIAFNNQGGSGDVNGNFQSYSQYGYFPNPTQSWQRCSWTFTNVVNKSYFLIYRMNSVAGSECLMTEFTLTEGSMPGGPGLTRASNCLNWFSIQTDKMVFNLNYPSIITSGLTLNLDAGFSPSFPTIPSNANSSTVTPWYDLSVNNFKQTLYNGISFSNGNGGTFVFDGVDDYINQNYPTSNFPSGSDANTINIWLKIPSTNTNGMEPFGMGNNSGSSSRIGIWLPGTAQNGVGTSVGQIGIESVNSAVLTTSIQSFNTWLNLCAVFNGGLEDNFTLYINGSSVSITKYQRAASGPATMNIQTSNSFLTFGGIPSVPSAHVYKGPIGPTQVYNRSLSSTEILQNYQSILSRFPILDFYGSSAISVSLRLLSSSYTGYVIRVRRSSDNTEQDIGFVGGDLDTTSLLTFCGNSNGFVSRWYNQGTSGSYFQNTTATEQPMIVTGGTLNTVNNKPAMFFDGIDDNLLGVGISAGYGSANFSVFGVGKRSGSGKYLTFIGTFEGYNGVWLGQGIDDKYSYEFPSTVGPGKIATTTNTDTSSNQVYLTGIFDGTNSKVYKNGLEVSSTQATANYDRGFNWVGRRAANPPNSFQRHMDGHMQEIISYLSNQTSNRINIEASIKNYYGI